MRDGRRSETLLALDAGLRETGWAVLAPSSGKLVGATGVVRLSSSRRSGVDCRVKKLMLHLDEVAERWQPGTLVHSRPTGLRWPVPALQALEAALEDWALGRGLKLHSYTAQQVRAAVAGPSNATKEQLSYAVMRRTGLIGVNKSAPEWEALAVGHFHLEQAASDGGKQALNSDRSSRV